MYNLHGVITIVVLTLYFSPVRAQVACGDEKRNLWTIFSFITQKGKECVSTNDAYLKGDRNYFDEALNDEKFRRDASFEKSDVVVLEDDLGDPGLISIGASNKDPSNKSSLEFVDGYTNVGQ